MTPPRIPQINPAIYARLNGLAYLVDRVPLTRQDHGDAAQSIQDVLQYIERLEQVVGKYQDEISQLKARPQNDPPQ